MLKVSHKSVVNGEIISDLSCHVSSKHVSQNFFYILLKIIVKRRQRERERVGNGNGRSLKVTKRSSNFNFCLELTLNTPSNQPTLPTGSFLILKLKATVGPLRTTLGPLRATLGHCILLFLWQTQLSFTPK